MPSDPNNSCRERNLLPDSLVADLEKVAALVHLHACTPPIKGDALALLRVLRNVHPKEWEQFAAANRLADWLAFPLNCDLAQSVERLLEIQEHLAFLSDHDALTGIGNRRHFLRRLALEVERALRSYSELSLIYLDLDDFKRINDTYGHSCGDIVLKRLACILKTSVRQYDVVARIGGEEFVVLLPSSSCWTGVMLANRLLELFRKETFDCENRTFSMTFSAGVASLALLGDNQNGEALLNSADKAMYAAKRKGKNAIVLADSDKLARDQASLVQAQEKQLLFSGPGSEQHV